jgi:hypothetical protein
LEKNIAATAGRINSISIDLALQKNKMKRLQCELAVLQNK